MTAWVLVVIFHTGYEGACEVPGLGVDCEFSSQQSCEEAQRAWGPSESEALRREQDEWDSPGYEVKCLNKELVLKLRGELK